MTIDEFWQQLCEVRGVETPCIRCGGAGVRTYGSTSTWGGGVGGQMMTNAVCDRCWGTGDEHRRGTSFREIERWKAAHDREKSKEKLSN
jgi:hypothetical protein